MLRDKDRLSRILPVIAVVCMSSSAVFVRIATAPRMVLALYRMVISALLMMPAALLMHPGEWKRVPRKDWLFWAAAGVCFGLHFYLYFSSLDYTNITTAVMLATTEIFYVAIFGYIFLHEAVSPKGWIGIGITFAGCLLLAVVQGLRSGGNVKGILLAAASSALAAAFTLLGRRCRAQVSNATYSFVVFSFGTVTLIAGCLLSGLKLTGYGAVNWLAGGGMAVMCTLLGHSMITWSLKYQPASYVSSVKMLTPACSTLLGWAFVGEKPLVAALLCCVVIIAGILYFVRHD